MEEQVKDFKRGFVRQTYERLSQDEQFMAKNKSSKLMVLGLELGYSVTTVQKYLNELGIQL